jgi:hypothetical protein
VSRTSGYNQVAGGQASALKFDHDPRRPDWPNALPFNIPNNPASRQSDGFVDGQVDQYPESLIIHERKRFAQRDSS